VPGIPSGQGNDLHFTDISTSGGRAAVGPVSGQVVLMIGLLFQIGWAVLALLTLRNEQKYRRRKALISIG